jgi:hypothetical protein
MTKLFGSIVMLLSLAVPAAAEEPRIDVDKLPIDIARIKHALHETSFREERDGLRLRYFLNISAQAPPLNIVINPDGRDSWLVGPVPHTAPTHKEFMDFVTPQEFRTPPADLTALLRWLADKASKK